MVWYSQYSDVDKSTQHPDTMRWHEMKHSMAQHDGGRIFAHTGALILCGHRNNFVFHHWVRVSGRVMVCVMVCMWVTVRGSDQDDHLYVSVCVFEYYAYRQLSVRVWVWLEVTAETISALCNLTSAVASSCCYSGLIWCCCCFKLDAFSTTMWILEVAEISNL